MSEPIDDKAFEEYLSRESQLSKRYRALGADEVPAELDGLVLAQARQAVAAKPSSGRKKPAWMRWTPPLALAASMVLVISIVIESGTRHEVAMRDMAATMPQSAPAQEEAATAGDNRAKQEASAPLSEPRQLSAMESDRSVAALKAEAPRMQARERTDAAPRREPVTVELKKRVIPPAELAFEATAATSEARSAPVAADMPPPAMKIEVPAPAPVSAVIVTANSRNAPAVRGEAIAAVETEAISLDEVATAGNSAQRTSGAGQGAGPRGTITSPTAGHQGASDEALLQQFRESDPRRWLEYIRELRRENKGAQADREWHNFLKAYPDYTVDEKDVARAKQ